MKITYWIATALLCLLMLFSAGMYLINYEIITSEFMRLGFPVWLIYPLAVLKICGVAVILWRGSKWATEWAYAGFFFNTLLAAGAHGFAGDPFFIPLIATGILIVSYFTGFYVRPTKNHVII